MRENIERKGASPLEKDRLESLALTDGYLGGATLEFVPGLNCIIGGRGSGKTTVVEMIRFAIEAPVPSGEGRAFESLIKANLGGGFGRAVVRAVSHHGGRYESSRAVGERARVKGASGEPTEAKLDGDLFRADIYGQNQILAIAGDPSAQLALLDSFAEEELSPIVRSIQTTIDALARNAEELLSLEKAAEADDELLAELAVIRESIAALSRAGTAESRGTDEAQRERAWREREKRAIDSALTRLSAFDGELRTFTARSEEGLVAISPEFSAADQPSGALFRQVQASLDRVAAAVRELSHGVHSLVLSAESEIAGVARQVLADHLVKDEAFEALVRSEVESRERIAAMDRLMKRALRLSDLEERVIQRRKRHDSARGTRASLLGDLERFRDARFAVRTRVATKMTADLDGALRVSVTAEGAFDAYVRLLEELLQGANIRPASLVRQIAERIRPLALSEAVRAMSPDPLVAIDDSKTGKSERALRILSVLDAHPRRFELDVVPVDDVPLIELRVGDGYKPSSRVSIGQRCTCILPLLLLQPRGPLIINQPEDHLDNAFIYDVLVKNVAIVKERRQLIFVTHNPNIPVLGSADRVFWLTSDGDKASLASVGTVDEVRGPLERVLEGGREAFVRRGERYGVQHG